jgi:hypothetical protein
MAKPGDEVAASRLSAVEDYVVGDESYLAFRQQAWPSFTILHMDVRTGAPETADAVIVLGIAGGDATAGRGAEHPVENALAIVDDRGLCIVRGWLDGQRRVAAFATECPQPVRQELDGILDDFDALTGGDAIWLLRFEKGLLQTKQRL